MSRTFPPLPCSQVAAVVVAELQASKLSLAESEAKEEQDGYAVTLPRTGRNELGNGFLSERSSGRVAPAWA